MPESPRQPSRLSGDEVRIEDLGHPRGTLAIVVIFGLLFLLGWVAMYVFIFLKRGAPQH
jgi:hypothetical protein